MDGSEPTSRACETVPLPRNPYSLSEAAVSASAAGSLGARDTMQRTRYLYPKPMKRSRKMKNLVRARGLEPPWDFSRYLLRVVRLPFRHARNFFEGFSKQFWCERRDLNPHGISPDSF